ncbi:MAG TPA: c-type cytochrome [Burkholderiales bacterium]|nr:c-type cytochrome [Burkholderiales bacterium]
MRIIYTFSAFCLAAILSATASAASPDDKATLARGKYLVATSGCNDCHTAGYPESGGRVPEAEWLTGSPVGFTGPWGTTYPANLRLTVQALSEDAWMMRARSELRPPMPWFSLRDMTDSDLRAMYRYIRSLGPKGGMAPAYVPPGSKVATPYIEFVPKNLPARAAVK